MPNGQPGEPVKWWGDPLAWVELFAVSNAAFLAVGISLAHAVNSFAHPAEYVPVAFSLVAPAVLVAAMWLGGLRPPLTGERSTGRRLARGLGFVVGWCSIAVGIAGMLFHLDSAFFEEQTLKNLVYTAPFAAPLAYTGLGFLIVLDRMVGSIHGRSSGHDGSSCSPSGVSWGTSSTRWPTTRKTGSSGRRSGSA